MLLLQGSSAIGKLTLENLDNLILSIDLIMLIGNCKEFLKMTFQALALLMIRVNDKGLTLEMSALETLPGGQCTLSTKVIESNYLQIVIPPTMVHRSFFGILPIYST